MRKLTVFALIAVLALSLLAGCRSRNDNETMTTTEAATTRLPENANTIPSTALPTVDPSSGAEDGMVDPTNGAIPETEPAATGTTVPRSKMRPMR